MEVTELPIVIEYIPLQYSKALSPMEMIELGIITDVIHLHNENAEASMPTTL